MYQKQLAADFLAQSIEQTIDFVRRDFASMNEQPRRFVDGEQYVILENDVDVAEQKRLPRSPQRDQECKDAHEQT
jgi:hypothetical protein